MDLQNMSQAGTEESSQSIFYNPDFIAIVGKASHTIINNQFIIIIRRRCLFLGRDRLTRTPLYVGIDGQELSHKQYF